MRVVRWEETVNVYDYRGLAVKATLECGHWCILTGDAIQQHEVACLPCGKNRKPLRYFWLSFADKTGHLGCCLVEVSTQEIEEARLRIDFHYPDHAPGAETVAAAIRKAHVMKCNPGGDVMTWELTERPMRYSLHVLMTKDEVAALDKLH